jgi:hypothetical protein
MLLGTPPMLHRVVIAALAVAAWTLPHAACGGAQQKVEIDPPPLAMTRATLSGPLCEAEVCRCRDDEAPGDGGAGAPDDPAVKRFEFRVGPAANPLWVTVDGQVLYKSEQRALDCFYLDLRPGKHQVVLRASRDGGLSAAFSVSEYGAATRSWYETFRFSCGSPGTCSHDEIDEEKARYAGYGRGVHDPCGSVKVRDIAWDTGRAPDNLHPSDVQLELTLDVYKFPPRFPHGAGQCPSSLGEQE